MEPLQAATRRMSDGSKALVRASRPMREKAAIGAQTVRFQLERAEDAVRTLAAVASDEGRRAARETLRQARRAPVRTALVVAGVGLVAGLLINGQSRRAARRRASPRDRA